MLVRVCRPPGVGSAGADTMDFNLIPALGAGLMATVVMSLFTEVVALKGVTSMPSMSFLIGSAFSGDRDTAMTIGNGLHFGLLGGLVSGIGYAVALAVVDQPSWMVGLGVGLVHGTLVGIALGKVEDLHPRMVDPVPAGRRAIRRTRHRSEVVAVKPGMFGVNWGDVTPVIIVSSYALYGLVYSLIYSILG